METKGSRDGSIRARNRLNYYTSARVINSVLYDFSAIFVCRNIIINTVTIHRMFEIVSFCLYLL